MTDKELKRLNRRELLEMMIDQEKEIERLQKKVEKLEAEAADRSLKIQNAGTMAEAALALNGVFEAADAAVKQFTENVIKAQGEQAETYQRIVSEAQAKADEILSEAEKKKADVLKEAEEGAEERWQGLYQRLEEFYAAHPGLKDALIAEKEKNMQTEAKG